MMPNVDEAESLRGRAGLPNTAAPTDEFEYSFEFFPPKTEKSAATLNDVARRLATLSPRFMTVTYGAGGSTREKTHDTVTSIQKDTGVPMAAHLTCVAQTREQADTVARALWEDGIKHIVALRGDPPPGPDGEDQKYVPHPGGYPYASDLVEGLKKIADFEISVACYPEPHPEAPTPEADLEALKRKVDAGADRAITQFCFDTEKIFRFRDDAAKAGIDVPIVPGILPITNFGKTVEFAGKCGAEVPQWVFDLFDGLDDDPETRNLVSATMASEQCRLLQAEGFKEFHFYTLNRADLSVAICHMLGIRPQGEAYAN